MVDGVDVSHLDTTRGRGRQASGGGGGGDWTVRLFGSDEVEAGGNRAQTMQPVAWSTPLRSRSRDE